MHKMIVLSILIMGLLGCVAAADFTGTYSGFFMDMHGEKGTISFTISQDWGVTGTTSSASVPYNGLSGTFNGSRILTPRDSKGCILTGPLEEAPSFSCTESNGGIGFVACASGPCQSSGQNFTGSYSGEFIDYNGHVGNNYYITIASDDSVTGNFYPTGCPDCGTAVMAGKLEGSSVRLNVNVTTPYGGKEQTTMTCTGYSVPSFSGALTCSGGGGATWFAACTSGTCTSSIICTESWSCTEFGDCSDEGVQMRTCSDMNGCNTIASKPTESQNCTPPKRCIPNWNCTDFSKCSASGSQIRTCSDANNCNITMGKPNESQTCICDPNWVCTEFSGCAANGTMERKCIDADLCATSVGKPPETESCKPPSNPLLYAGIVIALLVIAAVAFWLMKRKPSQSQPAQPSTPPAPPINNPPAPPQ